ncbi:PssD/Cps14F family polysaccharide biosynthesis glycosyltransferase [Niallia taxi]|uniref:PssD/Cps14F family polysaccharide biosynthesis glycosyltransferase n=1 Tax=Niallia taxi TaxID=2499688 RepID=UPI002E1A6024|nr:PssD/Cps14F family polysaccharide biosynthesis glycosyltransferase [Niallia taxi]MED4054189.1 PssD/Cps14F family polysaccharide biosynthesis glycosyltransferase [Niallia taxi]MED4118291.1 PssD/Cps14F family polysaccharide biosynthesis glycosyltransferase [Niallia taxi]
MNISLISSTGGHWTQLNNLYKEFQKNIGTDKHEVNISLITEKNKSTSHRKDIHFFHQQERKNKLFLFILIMNILKALALIIRLRPNYIISTGAGVTIPYLIFGKIFGAKIIFIESYAKLSSPTVTGRIVYKFADKFYVQWPEMLKFYPKGIYKGSLY